MIANCSPQYDFEQPIFKKHRQYIRYALEHIEMCKLLAKSDCIKLEVKTTASPLRIPSVYHIHYFIRSIVGIDAASNPIYGDHHTLELTIPNRYPIDPFGIYMITDLWHPNIKWDGKFKGRVCANATDFGKSYMLYQLVLRVGEILQYKNYLADHIPPFPEDERVAKWVREFAEPNGIVDRKKNICVDDKPLIRPNRLDSKEKDEGGEDDYATDTSDSLPKTNDQVSSGFSVKKRDSEPPQERPKIIIGKKK